MSGIEITRESALDVEEAISELGQAIHTMLFTPLDHSFFKEQTRPILERLAATKFEDGIQWARDNDHPALGTRE